MLEIGHTPRVLVVCIKIGFEGVSVDIFLAVHNIGGKKSRLFAYNNPLFAVVENNVGFGSFWGLLCRLKLHKSLETLDAKGGELCLKHDSLAPVKQKIGFLSDYLTGYLLFSVEKANLGLTGNVVILLGKVELTFHIGLMLIGLEVHDKNGIFAVLGHRLVLRHGKKGLGAGKLGNMETVIYNSQTVFNSSLGGRTGKNIVKFAV